MNSSPGILSLTDLGAVEPPVHLAIGMFDGVHLGHIRVVSSAVETARSADGLSAVLTFPGHPSQLLHPEAVTPLIISPEIKSALLLKLGVDHVALQVFDESFSKIEAEVFVSHLKDLAPSLAGIHVGKNFRFGRGRSGDVDLLAIAASKLGIELQVSAPFQHQGEPISSSRIRTALAQGEIIIVNEMLGRCYEVSGIVQRGEGRGAQLGFPTLNLPWHPGARPRYGVYAVELRPDESGQALPGVANYGVRPTFEQDTASPVLETHLFGDTRLQPGDLVRVSLQAFLREERKFESVEALQKQIARDKESARQALSP